MYNIKKYAIIAALSIFFLTSSVFVVDQRQQALVLQFGQTVNAISEPGLKFKIPFIQNVVFFDKRILDLTIAEKEVIASDQKRLIINAFTKYKIVDPLKFYTTVNNIRNAEVKLNPIVDSSLRKIIGEIPLVKLLSEDRSVIMSQIKKAVSHETQIFGVQIVDVRITRGDLPAENSNAIFRRMQTEREKEAREIRAIGVEESDKIRASADKERTIIVAEAKKQSNILRGEGESISTRIFAKTYSRDPEFFDFYRSMNAYEKSLKSQTTTLILSPNSEFFKFFGKIR